MENSETTQQETANKVYNYAADLLVNKKRSPDEVKNMLVQEGMDEPNASTVVEQLQNEIVKAKKERAGKDMLYGAMWCIGGLVATFAHIGFIFWGAIIFGGYQFFRGMINS